MKFHSPTGKLDSPELNSEYDGAERFDKLRIGKNGVFFPDGLITKYIPYEYIQQAFIRIHEVNGKLCCGSTVFQYFRLVFVHDGKEFADYISENEKKMDEALKSISQKCESIKIGYDV